MTRPTKKEYFMAIASISAERSTCPRANVGAVIIKDDVIISTGYNGACRSEVSCCDSKCDIIGSHCVKAIHAEMNSIINAARVGVALEGAQLYCTHKPCSICSRIIVNSGIKKVYFKNDYRVQDFDLSEFIEVKKI